MDNACSAPTKTDNGIMRFGAQDNGIMRFGAHDNAIMRFGAQNNGIMKVQISHAWDLFGSGGISHLYLTAIVLKLHIITC